MLGFNFVDDAGFGGLAVGVFVDTEILFGHLVDMIVGTLLSDFDDAAANLEITVGILRIDDGQSVARGVAERREDAGRFPLERTNLEIVSGR